MNPVSHRRSLTGQSGERAATTRIWHDSGTHPIFKEVSRQRYPAKLSWADPTGIICVVARHQFAICHGCGEVLDSEDSSVGRGDSDCRQFASYGHLEASLLECFPGGRIGKAFTGFDVSTWNRPPSSLWLRPAEYEHQPSSLIGDDSAGRRYPRRMFMGLAVGHPRARAASAMLLASIPAQARSSGPVPEPGIPCTARSLTEAALSPERDRLAITAAPRPPSGW